MDYFSHISQILYTDETCNRGFLIFQFMDIVRTHGLGDILRNKAKARPMTSTDILRSFKVEYSSNEGWKEQEEIVMTNFEVFLSMLEGSISQTTSFSVQLQSSTVPNLYDAKFTKCKIGRASCRERV